MNDEPPSIPPAVNRPPPSRRDIVLGFTFGCLLWAVTLVPQKDYGQFGVLVFDCFALPVIAAVLALIPYTQRFGLGLLLASGAGWLVLGAICGGQRFFGR